MNLSRIAFPDPRLLALLPLICCCLPAAPNLEPVPARRERPSAIERQRAAAGRQMASLSETAGRARQWAQSARERQQAAAERQRAAAERQRAAAQYPAAADGPLAALAGRRSAIEQQRASIGRQLASVEKQVGAVHPGGAVFTAAATADTADAASWASPAGPECRRIAPAEIHPYVEQVAKRESLSPELLRVVIAHESSFWPCAVSRKGAMGMMQLMPGTAADLGVTHPFDAEENIDGGARYLSYLKERFGGDLRLALAAYNAGPRRVDAYRGVPPIPETVSYVSSILRQLDAPARANAPLETP